MNAKIFGISWGLILLVLLVAFVVRKWGNTIPLINKVGAA